MHFLNIMKSAIIRWRQSAHFMDKPPEIYCSFALWIIQQIIVNNGDYGSNGYYLKTIYERDNFIY